MRLNTTGDRIHIEDRIPNIREVLDGQPGILAAYVFGSYGTPDQTPLSDVDIAILYEAGRQPDLEEELHLGRLVSEAAEEDDVNLTILNDAPLRLQHLVLATGRPIYICNPLGVADFQELVCKIYGDFAIDLGVFYAEHRIGLREVFGLGR